MSIAMDTACIQCVLRRNLETARKLGSEEQAVTFARRLMQQLLDTPENSPSPDIGPAAADLLHELYGLPIDRYREEKIRSNQFALARLDEVRARAEAAEDSVLAGLQFSILGNYLDFSALQGQVSFEKLDVMLSSALNMQLDLSAYHTFRKDLQGRKKLLYLTDNAGEIVLDRVFAELLQKAYPELSILFCVRGFPAGNDATREDAAAIGLPFPVIDNGSRIGGTDMEHLSADAKRAFAEADVILAKGMGNTETMLGCGYNVYYAFLIKCERIMRLFQKPMMTPMFLRDAEA